MGLLELPDDILLSIFDFVNLNDIRILVGADLLNLLLAHPRLLKPASSRLNKHRKYLEYASLEINAAVKSSISANKLTSFCSPATAFIALFQDPTRAFYVRSLHYRSPDDCFVMPVEMKNTFSDGDPDFQHAVARAASALWRTGKRQQQSLDEFVLGDSGAGLLILLSQLPNLTILNLVGHENSWSGCLMEFTRQAELNLPVTLIPLINQPQFYHSPTSHLTKLSVRDVGHLLPALFPFNNYPFNNFPNLRMLDIHCEHDSLNWDFNVYGGRLHVPLRADSIRRVTITGYCQPLDDLKTFIEARINLETLECTALDEVPINSVSERSSPAGFSGEWENQIKETSRLECYYYEAKGERVIVVETIPWLVDNICERCWEVYQSVCGCRNRECTCHPKHIGCTRKEASLCSATIKVAPDSRTFLPTIVKLTGPIFHHFQYLQETLGY